MTDAPANSVAGPDGRSESLAVATPGGSRVAFLSFGVVMVAIFIGLGFLVGAVIPLACIGFAGAVLIVVGTFSLRVSVGEDWLAIRKLRQVRWVDLAELDTVSASRSSGGTTIRLADSKGRKMSTRLELLRDPAVLAGLRIALQATHSPKAAELNALLG